MSPSSSSVLRIGGAAIAAALTGGGCSSAPLCVADASAALTAESGAGEAEASSAPATSHAEAGAPEVAAAPTLAGVRFANWSTDSPAVDFCLAPHGSSAPHSSGGGHSGGGGGHFGGGHSGGGHHR